MTVTDPVTRRELLACLPALAFVPPEDAAPWSLAARSAAFAAAVEAFAAEYWALPPRGERRVRYNQLWDDRVGPVTGRLAELAPGLDVDPKPPPDPLTGDVAKVIREWFVLPPADRAARRARWLRDHDHDRRWADAVRAVMGTDWELAALAPRLVECVTRGLWPTSLPLPPARVGNPTPRPADYPPINRLFLRSTVAGAVAVLVVVVAFALVATPRPAGPPRFTTEEVGRFLAYREMIEKGAVPPEAPPRYYDWLAAQQPKGVPE